MKFNKFNYKNHTDLLKTAEENGVHLPYSEDSSILGTTLSLAISKKKSMNLHNRLIIQPMEGCDSLPDGAPSEYTSRRYQRFAQSGAALIWTEANSVDEQYVSSNRQLRLHKGNLDAYKEFIGQIRTYYMREHGFNPVIIAQATHSGRYRKIDNVPTPLIAAHNEWIERDHPLPDSCIVTDDELRYAEERFGAFAQHAKAAGFDGMDIKCSHYYMGSELLSAYNRPGPYGGSFENRTRFLMNSMRAAAPYADDTFFLTCRLNGYDGLPYPWGFGVTPDGGLTPDYTEVNRIISALRANFGVSLINVTLGNPYFNPYVNRPYDQGPVEPTEHPLVGVARMISGASEMKKANPEVRFVGSGMSYLRQYAGYVAAGAIKEGSFDLAGFGRLALADPNFVQGLITGKIQENECCLTCSNCSKMMRAFHAAGCVVRDDMYTRAFQQAFHSAQGKK